MPAVLPEQYGQPKDLLDFVKALEHSSAAGRQCILSHLKDTHQELYKPLINFQGFRHILEPIYTSEQAIALSDIGNLNEFMNHNLKHNKKRVMQRPCEMGVKRKPKQKSAVAEKNPRQRRISDWFQSSHRIN